jgi:hypothetical protein
LHYLVNLYWMRDHSACNNHVFNDHDSDDFDYEFYLAYFHARDVNKVRDINKVREEDKNCDALLSQVEVQCIMGQMLLIYTHCMHLHLTGH